MYGLTLTPFQVSIDGSSEYSSSTSPTIPLTQLDLVESYCVPNFDSPSVFARILDKDKGGHFSIFPRVPFSTKQNYLPSSNVLQTKSVTTLYPSWHVTDKCTS